MDREKHVGRWVTAPDGFNYLITYIVDSNTFELDRPYAGSTSANETVSVLADTLPPGISEPGDGESWSADADDLAQFNLLQEYFLTKH